MKWVEIITLRSPEKINGQLVDELLKRVPDSDSPTETPTSGRNKDISSFRSRD